MPSPENIAFANDQQNGKIGGIALADLPTMVAERMSRSYASWLTWWKGTVNSDDYMKYLATQVSKHAYLPGPALAKQSRLSRLSDKLTGYTNLLRSCKP